MSALRGIVLDDAMSDVRVVLVRDLGRGPECYASLRDSIAVRYTGDRLECIPIGYLEQWENNHEDFDIIAVPATESHLTESLDLGQIHQTLATFIDEVFANIPERTLRAGDIHDADAAYALIDRLSVS